MAVKRSAALESVADQKKANVIRSGIAPVDHREKRRNRNVRSAERFARAGMKNRRRRRRDVSVRKSAGNGKKNEKMSKLQKRKNVKPPRNGKPQRRKSESGGRRGKKENGSKKRKRISARNEKRGGATGNGKNQAMKRNMTAP